MPRRVTVPNLEKYTPRPYENENYGWQATPFWPGLRDQFSLMVSQETRRLRETLAGDVRLLRIAWCVLRTLLS